MDNRQLFKIAEEMMDKAYVPYSKFHVGAALVTKDGKVFTGCNIENASYPVTICAERTAFSKAISEGYTKFEKIVIASSGGKAWPCGMCRQFMMEFCDDDFQIISGDDENSLEVLTLKEILPRGFKL
ncbi:MAG: cytidine deaminase [Clostridia bacterium]|nr:cytidine deaminase [Clostridia bacterium]